MTAKQTARRLLSPLMRPTQEDFPPTGRESYDTDLGKLFDAHDGRIVNKWVHYLPIYDRLLADWRGTDVHLLELGVSKGGSLQLWRKFLGPDAKIVGVDKDPACEELDTDDLPVIIGSQADGRFLRNTVVWMGGRVDVVIDDGSHIARHQRASFDALWPVLADGGLYIIEDTHTSYWLRHGGGWRRPGTAIQLAKGLVEGMHGWYHRGPRGLRGGWAMAAMESITFYDSMIVIKKGLRDRPVAERRPVTQS